MFLKMHEELRVKDTDQREDDKEEDIDVINCDEPHALQFPTNVPENQLQPPNYQDKPITELNSSMLNQASHISSTARSPNGNSTIEEEYRCNSPSCSPSSTVLEGSSHSSTISDDCTENKAISSTNLYMACYLYQQEKQGMMGKEIVGESDKWNKSSKFEAVNKWPISQQNQDGKYVAHCEKKAGACSPLKPMVDAGSKLCCKWLQCGHRFSNLDDLVNHVNDVHIRAERDVDYKCYWDNCPRKGKGFNARYKMLIHVRTHTNEKPYICELCHKSFSRLENLKIHNRSHTGERPYLCPFEGCKKAYSNSSDRFKHVRTHQEQKPYCCRMPGCDKRYTDPSSLRKHIKTHGHYFRRLPSGPPSKHRKIAVQEDQKQQIETLNDNSRSTDDRKECFVHKTCDETSGKHVNQSPVSVVGRYTPCSHPYPNLLLPSPDPNSRLQMPLAMYPSTEEYNYHQLHFSPVNHAGYDSSALKQVYDTSVLSQLSPLSPRSSLMGGSGLHLPLGNTLLAMTTDGVTPSTTPNQLIQVKGNWLHISNLEAEHFTTSQPLTTGSLDKYSHTQSASTQTDFDVKPSSASMTHLTSLLPRNLSLLSCRQDVPLDLSNPNSRNKKYTSPIMSRNEYLPIFTNV